MASSKVDEVVRRLLDYDEPLDDMLRRAVLAGLELAAEVATEAAAGAESCGSWSGRAVAAAVRALAGKKGA
jgi:hypothetical protein